MLIESVPNVSEGRRLDVVDRLADAIASVDGVFLLDRTSDASHNRSVFTIAGEDGPVVEALERLLAAAIHEIDMDEHTGEHPRIGAVDVIPFVPLGDTTLDDCTALARDFGARIADRFELPVFLYAAAARRDDRVKLSDVRRGQYEGLKTDIAEPGREPDLGPARMHPSAGAVAVGARPFLIAYNINLDSSDVDLAKRIARRIRESGGGLPRVQANGFWIEELGRAQVSMNILDFETTPLWVVWETVREVAAEDAVELAESELIGLMPVASFLAVADHAGAPRDAPVEADGLPLARFARVDARGGSVTPGLVDPHTHLLFGGAREHELVLRQQGAAYLDILAAGGGILSTVAATRAATADDLLAHGRRWLDEMLAHGVTTIEAKSGYGLDLETEIRLVDTTFRLGAEGPIDVVPTFLGAHAVAPEYRARPDGTEAYVRSVIEEQLPGIAAHGRARFCDVFCEDGVFSADQSRRILTAAAAYGMGVRLHADELAPSGGAELAVELGAASADHLATPSEAGIDALAAAAGTDAPVVATLLPVTTWFLMKDHHAPARTFIERGVPVAIGTDFNPGTSPTASLPLAMTAACVGLRMSPDEVLSAVTINAAQALGLADEIGSLEPGKAADLTVWRVPTTVQIPYWPAADLVRTVVKRGRVVLDRS